MRRYIRLYMGAALLAMLILVASRNTINVQLTAAAPPSSPPPPSAAPIADANDGFNALPTGLQGLSSSTLVHMGRIRYAPASHKGTAWTNPFSPLLNIAWGPERNTSSVPAGE